MIVNKLIITLCFASFVQCALEDASEAKLAEQLYSKLYKRQRAEQLNAIKSFQKSANYEKQHSMIAIMVEKVFIIIHDSRTIIESAGFTPGISEFPLDDKIRSALSNVLENTALIAEIILRFPDITIKALKKSSSDWDSLLQWSIAFANQAKYLIDKSTLKLLALVSQEMNYVERDPHYENPYAAKEKDGIVDEVEKKKRKKPKQIKKGPRLSSHSEL